LPERFRVEPNHAGIRELLRSDGVRRDLERRAARVAAAAGDGMAYDSDVGTNRARATVWTESFDAKVDEATERNLTRAIDAARG